MPRKAKKRSHPAPQAKHVRGASTLGKPRKRSAKQAADESLEELFGVEPFHRNEVSLSEINKLRNMIDTQGAQPVSREIEVDKSTLLMVTSGFGHRLMPKTAERIREFLRKG